MESLKVKDLREIARSRGLKGWYRLRKSDLISFIASEEQRELEEVERERQCELEEVKQKRQRELEEVNRRQQERSEKATKLEANTKLEKKAKSKARRQAKRDEAKREAERRAEVKRVETNQRKQRQENIAGERTDTKETKSQRKQHKRKRLERQAKQTETQREAHERANRKKNRKQAKRQHRATKKEEKQKLRKLQQQQLTEPAQPRLMSSALEGNIEKWFVSGEGYKDPSVFLDHTEDGVKEKINSVNGPRKVYTSLKCVLKKTDMKTGIETYTEFVGRSKTHTITTQIEDTYNEMKQKMLESLAKFQREGSGWQLRSVEGLDISVVKFDPLNGSGYSKLPTSITNKKAVINMTNRKCRKGETMRCKCEKCKESDMCFKWAITRALNPADDNPHRITKELREQSKKYNWEGIEFPTKVKDIHIWEKNNNIKVNVFGYDEDSKKIYVIKMCGGCESIVIGEDESDKFINLFLHDDNHYCVIKNLSRLVSSQYNKHKEKVHFCLKCQNGFSTSKVLDSQQEVCLQSDAQTRVYPNPGDSIKFRNFE